MNFIRISLSVLVGISLFYNSPPAWSESTVLNRKPVMQNAALQRQEKDLMQSIQKEPGRIEHQIQLARLYYRNRYYPQAVDVLENSIQVKPETHEAHFLLGKILGSQKADPERSLSELQKAVNLNPGSIPYLEELVNVYHRLER